MNYDELVTAATVGVGQRPVRVEELPAPAEGHAHLLSDDPATSVLDAAALLDAARRAGGFVPQAVTLPAAAPDETGPPVPPLAAELIVQVLGGELETEFLTAAAGRHMPARTLPALLAAGARDVSLRPLVAGVLGERGRWLARQQPEWLRVLDLHRSLFAQIG